MQNRLFGSAPCLATYRPSLYISCEEYAVDQALARLFGRVDKRKPHPPEHSGTPFGGCAALIHPPPYILFGSGLPGLGMPHIHSFPPIENSNASILILGSMPGKESLRAGQYYAHRRNAFWPIMGDLVGADPTLPYEARTQMLKSAGIALWDVLASCTRDGSLDSAIDKTSISPNDFKSFFLTHPGIAQVFFNGAVAEKCFRMLVQHSLEPRALHYLRLPSTSPANASIPYHQKLEAWKAIVLDFRGEG